MLFPHISTNPLSPLWKIAFDENVPAERRFSAKCVLPIAYVGGMIGYAVALPVRSAQLVIGLVKLPCVCCQESFLNRIKNVVMAIFAILGAVVGVICPPLAYKIDEALQRDNPAVWADQPLFGGVPLPAGVDPDDQLQRDIQATVLRDERAREETIRQGRKILQPSIPFFRQQALPLLKRAIPNEEYLIDDEESNFSYEGRLKAGILLLVRAGKASEFLGQLTKIAPLFQIDEFLMDQLTQSINQTQARLNGANETSEALLANAYASADSLTTSPLYGALTQFAGTMMAPACGPLLNILFSNN